MQTRLQTLRKERGLTQKQLAELLNMSQTGYSKYETGENDIPNTILIRLAEFYDTTTDFLLGRADQRI